MVSLYMCLVAMDNSSHVWPNNMPQAPTHNCLYKLMLATNNTQMNIFFLTIFNGFILKSYSSCFATIKSFIMVIVGDNDEACFHY